MITSAAQARRRPTGWIVAVCVLGVVAVVLTVAAATLTFGDQTPGTSAESSARASCAVLDEVPEEGFEVLPESGEASPHRDRLAAAAALAELAWAQDPDYKDLLDAMLDASSATSSLSIRPAELGDELRHPRDVCDQSGF